MTHEIGPQWEQFCEHKWTTIRFNEKKNGWIHYMQCTKCGATRSMTHNNKAP